MDRLVLSGILLGIQVFVSEFYYSVMHAFIQLLLKAHWVISG